MVELDDLTLARAKRGNPSAFRLLIQAHQGPVHAVIGRMLVGVASPAEVEELAQETFLRVHRALPGFDSQGPGRLKKWIVTIATRIAIDALRKRRPHLYLLDEERQAAPERADHLADGRALASLLAQAVSGLSADQRAVFLLREYHDFEYDEIARALDLEVGTVKSRLSRARAALRAKLKELGYVAG